MSGPFALCAYINILSVCHIHVRNYGIPMSLMIRATCTPRISLLQTQPHNVGVFFDTALLLQPMNRQNSGKCTPEEDLRRPGKEMTKLYKTLMYLFLRTLPEQPSKSFAIYFQSESVLLMGYLINGLGPKNTWLERHFSLWTFISKWKTVMCSWQPSFLHSWPA